MLILGTDTVILKTKNHMENKLGHIWDTNRHFGDKYGPTGENVLTLRTNTLICGSKKCLYTIIWS